MKYVGYSYIQCAWYAFPFEALEVFTFFSLQVGAAEFARAHAPPGMLATVTGLQGGAHNGLGKGFGGLLGGFTIEYTKSTHRAFWNFGLVAFLVGVIYSAYVLIMLVKKKVTGKTSAAAAETAKDSKTGEPEEENFLTAVPVPFPDLEKRLSGNGAATTESKEVKEVKNNLEREAGVNGAPKEAHIGSPAF